MAIPEIDVAELARLRTEGEIVLVDVRQPDEHAEARVPGTVLIPLGEVAERFEEVPNEGTVYVICARGARSMKAAEFLAGQGYDPVNVAGGTLAWIDAGHETESG
jgi:rhodanese-related sulfurtransferase